MGYVLLAVSLISSQPQINNSQGLQLVFACATETYLRRLPYVHGITLKTPILMILSVNAAPEVLKLFSPPLSMTSSTALAAYSKNLDDPACVHAMCEDYRSSSPGGGPVPQGPDYTLDKADLANLDNGRRVKCDLMVLWAERGVVGMFWDPKKEWRKFCVGEVLGRAVASGHFIPEGKSFYDEPEVTDVGSFDAEMDTKELVDEIFEFFKV